MKGQDRITAKELDKMEINSNKVMVIKIFAGFEKRMEDLIEIFNKEIKNIKKKFF